MNISGIDYESINDGEGVRTVMYVSGCFHNCFNCHNPDTHDINYGIPFAKELQDEIIENIQKRPFVSGLTWSGGDPLHENNLDDVLDFTDKFHLLFPHKTIWLYSGYTWEEIMNYKTPFDDVMKTPNDEILYGYRMWKRQQIIKQCTVMVDGRYIDSQKDLTLKWCGSKNQHIIDIQKSLQKGEAVLWTD